MHDDGKAASCAYVAEIQLCASHQNIRTALTLHAWLVRCWGGGRGVKWALVPPPRACG